MPAVPNCYCLKRPAPYWSYPPVLIFDIRALWRSVLSARAPECQKSKLVGWTSRALNASNSKHLEQPALKGVKKFSHTFKKFADMTFCAIFTWSWHSMSVCRIWIALIIQMYALYHRGLSCFTRHSTAGSSQPSDWTICKCSVHYFAAPCQIIISSLSSSLL